jgi:hypothetical protein
VPVQAFPWLLNIVQDHAAAMAMAQREFESIMAAGFSSLANDAIERFNSIVADSPFDGSYGAIGRANSFHDDAKVRRSLTPEQRSAYDDFETAWTARKDGVQRVAHRCKDFRLAYSRYDSMLAAGAAGSLSCSTSVAATGPSQRDFQSE